MALLITVIAMLIVTLLLTVVFSTGLQSLPLAQHAQQYQAALQAADTGVQDYVSRLDANTAYYLNTADSNNPAMTGWVAVAGSNNREWYRYVVNNAKTITTGTVYLTVTGAAGQKPGTSGARYVLRTVKEALSLAAFTSSLYFTEYETEDPAIVPSDTFNNGNPSPTYTQACNYDAWQYNTYLNGNPANASSYGPDAALCSSYEIYFVGNDTLNGAIFSDDEFNICGAANLSAGASSAWDQGSGADKLNATNTADDTYYGNPVVPGHAAASPPGYNLSGSCTGTPQFATTMGPQPASAGFKLLTTNQTLESNISASNDGGGCLYYGPIQVTLNATNPATMTVKLATGSSVASTSGTTTCSGTNIPYPNNGLMYDATSPTCSDQSVCGANVYVQGTVEGPLTIGSDNNITITNSIIDATTTGGDILGLSADNYIYLPDSYNTIPGQSSPMSTVKNLTIDAAMVSVYHTIYLPNWATDGVTGGSSGCTSGTDKSTLCTLTILGSVSQVYRGPVGTFSGNNIVSGYAKSYSYDTRLEYLQPPYFNSSNLPDWQQTSFTECNPTLAPTTTTC